MIPSLNPFLIVQDFSKMLGSAKSYSEIYSSMKSVINLIDTYDDCVRDGINLVLTSPIVQLPVPQKVFISAMLEAERASMSTIVTLMKDAEDKETTNTPFEKLMDVVQNMSKDNEDVKSKAVSVTKEVLDVGNTVNNIYKMAKGLFS